MSQIPIAPQAFTPENLGRLRLGHVSRSWSPFQGSVIARLWDFTDPEEKRCGTVTVNYQKRGEQLATGSIELWDWRFTVAGAGPEWTVSQTGDGQSAPATIRFGGWFRLFHCGNVTVQQADLQLDVKMPSQDLIHRARIVLKQTGSRGFLRLSGLEWRDEAPASNYQLFYPEQLTAEFAQPGRECCLAALLALLAFSAPFHQD